MPAAGPLFFVSLVIGFVLMWPVGWLFGQMGWPMFHGWGLAHGAFAIAWPVLSLLALAVLLVLVRKFAARDGVSGHRNGERQP
jgi:uncharacterized membrane protein